MLLKQKTTALLLVLFLISANVPCQLSPPQMDSLVKELAKATEDTNKVHLLKTLANEIGYTDYKKALEYAQQGYALSEKLGYEKGMGIMAYIIGFTYTDMGNFSLSDSFLNIAGSVFQKLRLANQLAKVEHARGVRNYKAGNYWPAADFFAKSVKLFEEIGRASCRERV